MFCILTLGFADDDEVELSNGLSPDQGKVNQSDLANQSDLNEDPELNEIAKKLKELEASSDSEDEVISQEVISEEVIPIEGCTPGYLFIYRTVTPTSTFVTIFVQIENH